MATPEQQARYRSRHPDRIQDQKRRYRAEHPLTPEQYRKRSLRQRYGITVEDYDRMLEEQGGHCALCPAVPGVRRLHVDHDHVTGRVRGLLCLPCNGAVHYLEREGWLDAALAHIGR